MFDVDQCIKNVKGLGWLGTAPHYGENLSENASRCEAVGNRARGDGWLGWYEDLAQSSV
jgi:hypothetical protein